MIADIFNHSRITVVCLMFLAATVARGQSLIEAKPESDFSKEPFIVETLIVRTNFHSDGAWTRHEDVAIRMQSDAGIRQYGVLSFGYSGSNDKIVINYVRVRKVDGTLILTPPENTQDVASQASMRAPAYSDYREKHIAVKGLGVGDLLEYEVVLEEIKPFAPGQFWLEYNFNRSAIVMDEEVEIEVPKNRFLTLKSPELEPAVAEVGDQRIYSWKTSNHEHLSDEKQKEAITIGRTSSISLTTFKNWQEVAQWWHGLEQEQAQVTPEIRAKEAEVTKGTKSDLEKLRAIYNYVSTRFRYVSLSFGIGRYQPHSAAEVLSNEYGDCKDKHTLLESLLRAAGIESYPVLIHSTRKLDPDYPSPGQFDHVISVVPLGKELIWLDTTAEVSPFGFLLANLRDKQVLLVTAGTGSPPGPPAFVSGGLAASFPLIKTPADPPFPTTVNFEIDAKLDDTGTLRGKIERSFRGDAEVLLRAAFRSVPQAEWKTLVQKLSYATGFAGDVDDVTADAPEDTREPFRFSYSYLRQNYPNWAGKQITLPSDFRGLPEMQSNPVILGPPATAVSIGHIEVPEAYDLDLPPAMDLIQDFAEFHAGYSFEKGIITFSYRFVSKVREVQPSRREDYQPFVRMVDARVNQSVSLRRLEANPEAASLLRQAGEAFRAKNLTRGGELLEEATRVDPDSKDAWAMLGRSYISGSQPEKGIAALRTAIKLGAHDVTIYRFLAAAYSRLGRSQDAIDSWRELQKVDPNNLDAHGRLGDLLLAAKKYSEAIPEYQAVLNTNPKQSLALLGLGNAYLGLQDEENALDEFRKAFESDPDPNLSNNIAFALADSGRKLSEAKFYAEKAVTSEEARTADMRLDSLKDGDLLSTRRLSVYWDTLGWVYFREGELAKALAYMEPAWNLQQSAAIADHLGQIYEAQGKLDKAGHLYAMAMGLQSGATEARKHIERLIPDKAKREDMIRASLSDLAKMRTLRFPRSAPGKLGTAEFFVLFGPGAKLEDVRFIKGDENLKDLSRQLSSASFSVTLPEGSEARIVRRGILTCTTVSPNCDFVLLLPESVGLN